ncbi:IclR family transcriptional regulator [Nonomuraea soli]|uniref:Glycerol operon regulatory protein n=1 Tax=Nonomuraea soli TaxID=1032476 RepID=A0A7W0CFJ0_9ACTN|nr:IclR family transcriptional regulator [Nonomuraea soli]MBA2890087.1 DNA-binding IclR family transcriptional regulator [Nonomuraea soli]
MDEILYSERMGENSGGTQPVKSAARALDILEDLAANGPASLHVLATRMGLPKSSLHALLRTMQARGWIETDATDTLYALGIHSLLVGSAYLDGDLIVGRTAPLLDELARATGETVHLARLEGGHVVYTAKRESVHPLRMFSAVGRRLPVYSTALGRAILAEMDDERARALLPAVLDPVTPHTNTDPERLIGLLAEVRRDGYAVEHEESCIGLACIAVALPFTQPGRYAISVSVPLARLDDESRKNVVEQLLAARQSLEHQPFSRKS